MADSVFKSVISSVQVSLWSFLNATGCFLVKASLWFKERESELALCTAVSTTLSLSVQAWEFSLDLPGFVAA